MSSNKGSIDRQRFTPVTAASVPTPPTGDKTLFLDSADATIKQKDDTGTSASVGGGLSQAQVLARGLGA